MPGPDEWTAQLVAQALREAFLSNQWGCATFAEFELPADDTDEGRYLRRADLLTIFINGLSHREPFVRQRKTTEQSSIWLRQLPPGWRSAFEIKVSRADFRVDAKQRLKHMPIRRVVNEMFFVYPAGLISIIGDDAGAVDWRLHRPDEDLIPYGCGAIEVYRDQRRQWLGRLRARIVRAPSIALVPDTPKDFVLQLARRAMRRGYGLPAIPPADTEPGTENKPDQQSDT